MEDLIMQMNNVTKTFPGVVALSDVNLDIRRGEVMALCGENGAGKSTLIKILSGIYPAGSYQGEVIFDGQKTNFAHVKDSENAGVATIFQELELIKELSIAENTFLGNQPTKFGMITWEKAYASAKNYLKEVGLDINPSEKIKNLSIAQQQLVEIAKALTKNAKLLVLDEPTSSLTDTEVEILFNIIRKIKANGISCLYISHRLEEVFKIADRVSVLRDGKFIGTREICDTTRDELIYMMVGREINNLFPKVPHPKGKVSLEVKNLTAYDPKIKNKKVLDDISFKAYEGEILGISGLMGAGRTELATCIFGEYDGTYTGEIFINGHKVRIKNSKEAIKQGIAYLSEDRKLYGLVLGMDVKTNITLSSLQKISGLYLNNAKEINEANKYVSYLKIKTPSLEQKVNNLSGGNQQKVVVGKWLMAGPKILIMDEPTRGIDVAVKYEMYKIMNQLVEEGTTVIMISSELPEIMGMADRVIVVRNGKAVAELEQTEIQQEIIMKHATGVGASQC